MIRRGQVWWADLREPEGSEPGYRRPVLVLQCDYLLSTNLPTAIVAIFTTNPRLFNFPGNIPIPRKSCGLPEDSVLNLTQILTINRARLDNQVGALPAPLMKSVDARIREVLDV